MKLKQLASALVAIGALGTAGVAHADLYPDFTVNPAVFPGSATTIGYGITPFVADKITGNYVEVITFGAGTFNISLKFQAGQFVADDGTTPLNNTATGLGTNYGLYALFQGSGTFTTDSAGATSFSLSPGGSLSVYVDHNGMTGDTTFTTPSDGSTAFGRANASDDTLIATGGGISGNGNVTCTGGNNCGSFGQTTSFSLTTPAGTSYFIQPQPFYDLSLQSGQFNGFAVSPGATQTLNGSMDVIFARVPEPSSIALVGAAFVGLGFAARRKKA